MDRVQKVFLLESAEQANRSAERAYWWMQGIDRESAETLGVADKVADILSLLKKVDNITMDIIITINKTQK